VGNFLTRRVPISFPRTLLCGVWLVGSFVRSFNTVPDSLPPSKEQHGQPSQFSVVA